uniref:Uncharacterized protein n=1 Tax=Glossina pallidipes TaxID=7398 RepID=A0A1A9ZWD1_GLOPL
MKMVVVVVVVTIMPFVFKTNLGRAWVIVALLLKSLNPAPVPLTGLMSSVCDKVRSRDGVLLVEQTLLLRPRERI